MSYWIKKTLPKLDQCQLDNYKKASEEKRVLSLKDFTGPFLFLLAGMTVSFLVFLIEKIVFTYKLHNHEHAAIVLYGSL